jgi:acetate kinase
MSVDTSMGLTPLEGLLMGTRSGDFDPAIVFHLIKKGYDAEELNRLCNRESGLLGISGVSNDVRVLMEQIRQGHERAQLAIDMFCLRVKKYIGTYSAVLGTVDAIVFTGGIGENSAEVRANCCSNLDQLGVHVDPQRNSQIRGEEAEIQADQSRVRVLVIPTDEEGVIARDTYELTR